MNHNSERDWGFTILKWEMRKLSKYIGLVEKKQRKQERGMRKSERGGKLLSLQCFIF